MDSAIALGTAGSHRLPGHALRVLKDEKLAAMVTAGRDEAFATLYQRHHQAIYRYCLSMLRQEADARDALQSSMLAALSSLRASPIDGDFKPWLFRIAHNQSISIIRGRAHESPTDAPPETPSSDDPETREELRILVSDLAALPERQRGAIVMRELSGLSYAQIAAALATSEAGGKQLVYEARTAMQELREGHEMSCELVRERISAGDRRLLRGRKVRSHLRGCQPCQDFERGIDRRRAAFVALAPPLPALAAAAVLQDVFGAGGGSGGAGAAGGTAATAAGGAASGSASLAGTAALKFTAAALLAGAAGVGAYEAGSAIFGAPPASTSAALEEGAPSVHGGDHAARAGDSARAASAGGKGGAGGGAGTKGETNSGGSKADGGASGQGSDSAPGATAGSDGTSGGGSTGGGDPGGGGPVDPPPDPPPPPPDPPPPPPDPPAPGTPPGHGGTPPGQGGTPPGQVGGDTPPGHIGNPGGGPP
jgi:RNA polymerase sigma factor (sigma-70 family)